MQKKNIQFNKTLPKIQKPAIQHREKFYDILNNIANRLKLQDSDGSYTKKYKLKIPFILQTLYNCKVVLIKAYRHPNDCIYLPKPDKADKEFLTIHVMEGALSIATKNHAEILSSPATYFIEAKNTNVIAKIHRIPTNITIIIQNNISDNKNFKSIVKKVSHSQLVRKNTYVKVIKDYNTNNYNVKTPLPDIINSIPKTKNKLPISYIRAKLTKEETNLKTIFIDAEFVQTRKGQAPGCITILNYDGNIIFDRIVKPNEKVIGYVPFITGFNKQIIDAGMLEKEALKIVHDITLWKILVGSDLTQDIQVLKINKNNLLGIRNLSTSKSIRKIMNVDTQKIGLASMVRHFFHIEMHGGIHSSLEDTEYIRKIYLEVLNNYEDDFYNTDDETDSFGTPLLDEISMDYQLDPISDIEIDTTNKETPCEISDVAKHIEGDDTNFVLIKIPKKIVTTDGKVLKPECMLYSDIYSNQNKDISNFKTTFKYTVNI